VLEGNIVSQESPTAAPTVAPGDDPDDASDVVDHSSRVLSSNTDTVFGVAVTHNAAIYTDSAQFVYGVPLTANGVPGGGVITFTDTLEAPRGIVWDGDGTVYVADQGGNTIYSLPVGRLAATSAERVVDLHDAYGLALLSETDPAWSTNQAPVVQGGGTSISLAWMVAVVCLVFSG